MAIGEYFFRGYWCILVVINGYYINGLLVDTLLVDIGGY
jgi:hypothetical protein